MSESSEFGKGYAYCLGLFLAHENRTFPEKDPSYWFYAAADHLYELQIPEKLPTQKKEEIKHFVDKCLSYRSYRSYRICTNGEIVTKEHISIALTKAKGFLLEWDQFNNIPSEKGDYE